MEILELTTETQALLHLAEMVGPESEGLDLSDRDYTLEELVAMRSKLSATRRAIDVVNKALAKNWDDNHGNAVYEDEHKVWSLGRPKGKRIIDTEVFYQWLATKDAEDLAGLVSASAVKVGGMTPAERDSLLDETSTQKELSINNKDRR